MRCQNHMKIVGFANGLICVNDIIKTNKTMVSLKILLKNKKLIVKSLNMTRMNYRPYDPSWYLYNKVCKEKNINNKFSNTFIELIYVTLSSWNMNSRGAKLSDFNIFKKSIIQNKSNIIRLSKYKINRLSRKDYGYVLGILKELFYKMKLVGKNNNKRNSEKPRLVTFSKTMHFLLTDLVVPIDRKYTLNFFYNNMSINKKLDLQFKKFSEIFANCREFAINTKLKRHLDNDWNLNIPKVIDNIIIGYSKLKK